MLVKGNIHCCRTSKISKFLTVLFIRGLSTENIVFNIRQNVFILINSECTLEEFSLKAKCFWLCKSWNIFTYITFLWCPSSKCILVHAACNKQKADSWNKRIWSNSEFLSPNWGALKHGRFSKGQFLGHFCLY